MSNQKAYFSSIDADTEYGRRIKKNIREYESFALRNGSLSMRNAFSLAATNFQLRYNALQRFLETKNIESNSAPEEKIVEGWDDQVFLALARILANQRVEQADLNRSALMFEFAVDLFGTQALKSSDRLIYLEVLGELGRYEELRDFADRSNVATESPVHLALLLQNEIHEEADAANHKWIDKMNELYQSHGVSPIQLQKAGNSAPLDQLSTRLKKYYDGPLVSVIVPSYRGGKALLSAIESLLNQSWKNLEIIIVDDGSGPEYEDYLKRAEALSLKVRVNRQPQNLGTYSARNVGLREANGEFVTVHDDDDWSHGDKIAMQVRHLMRHPHVAANMSAHTRVTENLRFVRINNNPFLLQPNYSSLMLRRTHLLELGGWDPTNRGADSELRQRVQLRFGKDVKLLGTIPLSFTRTWDGSLTAGEIQRGFIDPARTLYQSSYKHWHRKAKGNLDLLKPSTPRNYAIPTNMQAGKRHEDLGYFDVVFMTDFRFPGGTSSLTLAEIRASSLAGYRVGFIHAESPLNSTRDPVSYELFEMQRKGVLTQISLQDSADIRLLLVRHPSVVTYLDTAGSNLRVKKSLLIVNNPPALRGGEGAVFDLSNAITNMDRIFGCKTNVVAESGVTRRLCEEIVPPERLLAMTWPGMVKHRSFTAPLFAGAPVVGRHSRDHALKWPASRVTFDRVYTSAEFQAVFLGGADSLVRKHGSGVLENKTVYQFNEISVDHFLKGIDFWVYFHDPQLYESFGMAIAEAMAAGKVVILPEYLEQTFGEGAVYTDPEYVEGIILHYWREPALYLEQSEKARAYVLKNFSPKSFLYRLGDYLKK